jgi:CheY-like chemotaxis protein
MARILAVDDCPPDLELVGRLLAGDPKLEVEYAVNGIDALAKIERAVPDLVVTDLRMPQMDGLALTQVLVEKYPLVPVILITGRGNEETAVQALQRGAASYVPKRRLSDKLLGTVQEVLKHSYHRRYQTQLMGCMTRQECRFDLDNDPSLIDPLIIHLQDEAAQLGLCDAVEGTRLGVALEEALKNALYHGNLEIGHQLAELDQQGRDALVAKRRQEAPYRDRRIHVEAQLSPEGSRFEIRDDGRGFDPAIPADPNDSASLERTSGRGLLLMRALMDEVVYNEAGNAVTLVKRRSARTT